MKTIEQKELQRKELELINSSLTGLSISLRLTVQELTDRLNSSEQLLQNSREQLNDSIEQVRSLRRLTGNFRQDQAGVFRDVSTLWARQDRQIRELQEWNSFLTVGIVVSAVLLVGISLYSINK